jgi:hypothetical protein
VAAKKSTIEHRRRVRALEAKRDALMHTQTKSKVQLAALRAELKSVRGQGAK